MLSVKNFICLLLIFSIVYPLIRLGTMTATQKKWLKWAILSLIVISLAALAYWYFKPKPQKPNYITANVERSDIENSVMSTGKIEGIKQVDVGAQVSGEVTKLYVEVGDTVKKAMLLLKLTQLPCKIP